MDIDARKYKALIDAARAAAAAMGTCKSEDYLDETDQGLETAFGITIDENAIETARENLIKALRDLGIDDF